MWINNLKEQGYCSYYLMINDAKNAMDGIQDLEREKIIKGKNSSYNMNN